MSARAKTSVVFPARTAMIVCTGSDASSDGAGGMDMELTSGSTGLHQHTQRKFSDPGATQLGRSAGQNSVRMWGLPRRP